MESKRVTTHIRKIKTMEPAKILTADWLDLLFKNRNKFSSDKPFGITSSSALTIMAISS